MHSAYLCWCQRAQGTKWPIRHRRLIQRACDYLGDRPATDAKRGKAETLAKERGEKLLARAKEIGLDKAAAEQQLTVETTGPFERRAGVVPQLTGSMELRTDALGLTTEAPLGPKVWLIAAVETPGSSPVHWFGPR